MSYHVYAITNITNGKVYVGLTNTDKLRENQTISFGVLPERFAEHVHSLKRGDHYNDELQQAWDEGSFADFTFPIIEDLPLGTHPNAALTVEKQWIKAFPDVYNQRGRKPFKHAALDAATIEEIKVRLKAGQLGKDIASTLGVSTASVSLIKTKCGINARQVRIAAVVANAVRRDDGSINYRESVLKLGMPYSTFYSYVQRATKTIH
jgi:hypothetical protein